MGLRQWGIFVSVQELDKNAFIEGYEMESLNRGLGPSGWSSKGSLSIFDYSEPNEY